MPKKRNGKVPEKVKKYVKAELSRNIENKHYNFIIAQTGVNAMDNNTGVIFPLAGMATGGAINQRLGNSVRIKRIKIDWNVQMGAGIATHCRIIIVQDKQQAGVNPTLGQVLDPGGGGIGTIQAPVTPYNPYLTPTRFTVLKDWKFNFDNVEKVYTQKTMVIPGSKISQVHYQNTGTLDGKGMLYALCFSSTNVAANCPRLTAGCRVDYEDA